jgi:hypothetical protein
MAIQDEFLLSCNDGFLMSAEMTCLQPLARCGGCIGRAAPQFDDEGNSLTHEQAANLQWVRCSQCRCGTHDWYQR